MPSEIISTRIPACRRTGTGMPMITDHVCTPLIESHSRRPDRVLTPLKDSRPHIVWGTGAEPIRAGHTLGAAFESFAAHARAGVELFPRVLVECLEDIGGRAWMRPASGCTTSILIAH
jgi:hypothetical protein